MLRSRLSIKVPKGIGRYISMFFDIYKYTAVDSLLRRYLVALCAKFSPTEFRAAQGHFPYRMLVDFGIFMIRALGGLEKELVISDYFVEEQ